MVDVRLNCYQQDATHFVGPILRNIESKPLLRFCVCHLSVTPHRLNNQTRKTEKWLSPWVGVRGPTTPAQAGFGAGSTKSLFLSYHTLPLLKSPGKKESSDWFTLKQTGENNIHFTQWINGRHAFTEQRASEGLHVPGTAPAAASGLQRCSPYRSHGLAHEKRRCFYSFICLLCLF